MKFKKIRIFEHYNRTIFTMRYDLEDVPFETTILVDGRYKDSKYSNDGNHNYINITFYIGGAKKRFCVKDINNINYNVTFDNTNKKIFQREHQLIERLINEFSLEQIHNFYIYFNGV